MSGDPKYIEIELTEDQLEVRKWIVDCWRTAFYQKKMPDRGFAKVLIHVLIDVLSRPRFEED